MAAVGRIFRLSTFTVAAGGALRLSKDISDNARRSPQNPNLELVMVQIAFRHGARTPIFTAPCKELESVTWPADLLMGALPHTDIDYELKHVSGGIKPFSKYDDRQKRMVLKGGSTWGLLTKGTCNSEEIFIRTTNIQRTVDSARCVVAGMFGKEKLKGGLVTMHTENEEKEYLYPNLAYCGFLKSRFKYAIQNGGDSAFHIRQKKIGEALNMNYEEKPAVAVHLRDIVVTMKAHNMDVPQIILQNMNLIQEQALQVFIIIQCGLSNMRKEYLSVGIGGFLEEMTDNMIKTIDGQSRYKMILYSVHDTSVGSLLIALGIFEDKWPDFAADLAFELYRDKDQGYFVRVLYQGKEKILPGCSSPLCPLNKFKELVSEYFIDNWEKECQVLKEN
ncbi:Lysophosphatidic acid phosphatase type 6 [Desmophyllum pertusum]|uniref:Lysophosphatidic acid phosphatase type 6 n=1 Tax=Desmophyllum pertusum TaxID=174260 RepID=A0A9X0DBN3_9CNID|nr:Lysophosphatidic acid phosphatase type 6 [Desmophyllum pertusum]